MPPKKKRKAADDSGSAAGSAGGGPEGGAAAAAEGGAPRVPPLAMDGVPDGTGAVPTLGMGSPREAIERFPAVGPRPFEFYHLTDLPLSVDPAAGAAGDAGSRKRYALPAFLLDPPATASVPAELNLAQLGPDVVQKLMHQAISVAPRRKTTKITPRHTDGPCGVPLPADGRPDEKQAAVEEERRLLDSYTDGAFPFLFHGGAVPPAAPADDFFTGTLLSLLSRYQASVDPHLRHILQSNTFIELLAVERAQQILSHATGT
ncbi:hypothetical protein DIPPA_33975 [Diplonema papillatum]|nr:hypothetical protein DIPPA_33975 [Diplonema papillatum]